MTHVEREALSIWRANPHLALAHGDFGAFLESRRLMHEGRRTSFAERLANLRARNAADSERAAARLRLARSPRTLDAGASPVERIGDRLIAWIYGPIGHGASVDPGVIADALEAHRDARVVMLRIASAGGKDVAANEITAALLAHPARTVAIIDRFAYSAASLIASHAHRVFIRADATWMAHRAWTTCTGDVVELARAARGLRASDHDSVRGYCTRRRASRRTVSELIRSEAYLSAPQALAAGVVDEIIRPIAWANFNQETIA